MYAFNENLVHVFVKCNSTMVYLNVWFTWSDFNGIVHYSNRTSTRYLFCKNRVTVMQ